MTYYAVDYDGKNARAVTCPNIQPVDLGIGEVGLFGGVGYDFWEGEAGKIGRASCRERVSV